VMIIRFHPEAEKDFHDGITWYSKQRKGLDAEFVMCVDEAIHRITYNPNAYPVVHLHYVKFLYEDFPISLFMNRAKRKYM